MADGVGLTEVKKTEAIDYGTEETIEYELWCRKHNPVSGRVPCSRSINRTRDQTTYR